MTVGVVGAPLQELLSVGDPTAVVARVAGAWDADDDQRCYPTLIDELARFRETSPTDTERLAAVIFAALVGFGEDLPDMYWVHVAVLCSEMLVYGVAP